jgi:hypothetical protein
VLHGLHWLAAELAESTPLLLAVDDAHWADPPSLGWLEYLGPRLAELPVILVLSARGDGAPIELTAPAAHPWARVLRPAPLSRAACRTLLTSELDRTPDDAFAAAVLGRAAAGRLLPGRPDVRPSPAAQRRVRLARLRAAGRAARRGRPSAGRRARSGSRDRAAANGSVRSENVSACAGAAQAAHPLRQVSSASQMRSVARAIRGGDCLRRAGGVTTGLCPQRPRT